MSDSIKGYSYSDSTKGFYNSEIHVEIPSDAIEISNVKYQSLIIDVSKGMRISVTDGIVESAARILTQDQKIVACRNAVNFHINQQAQQVGPYGFDSIISAVSYADDLLDTMNQPYGLALKDWRRECWNVTRDIISAWLSGGPELTPDEVVAQLPIFGESV